jgi:tetratricopeptide (TPR) repeat protein
LNALLNNSFAFSLKQILEDLKQAARLDPENPRLIGLAALSEISVAAVSLRQEQKGPAADQDTAWDRLPPPSRIYLREAMSRLEKLGRLKDEPKAASALYYLGCLQAVTTEDFKAAEKNLRQALALQPAADHIW